MTLRPHVDLHVTRGLAEHAVAASDRARTVTDRDDQTATRRE